MFKDLSEVRIEGASIVFVMEHADARRLAFQISYPIPEGGSDFLECALSFETVSRYIVEERGIGAPIIQRVEIEKAAANSTVVRIHTDKGLREVNCMGAFFREGRLPQTC